MKHNILLFVAIVANGFHGDILASAKQCDAGDSTIEKHKCCTCPGHPKCYTLDQPYDHLRYPACISPIMKLFTKRYSNVTISRFRIPRAFNGRNPTVFIIHGVSTDSDAPWMHNMKKAFLSMGNYNVILVDWGQGAKYPWYLAYTEGLGGALLEWYTQALSNTRTVGTEVQLLSKRLVSSRGSAKYRQHCVGHSLGAHVCGFAGFQGKQFGRISGLDPARPLVEKYSWYENYAGLTRYSADFVDVIHTDGFFGTHKPIGHVDFYPNGGQDQPGCLITSICDHSAAHYYYNMSIGNRNIYHTYERCNITLIPEDYSLQCSSRSFNPIQQMGFYSKMHSGRGVFTLTTDPVPDDY